MGLAESPAKSLLVPAIKENEAGLGVDRAQCYSGEGTPSFQRLPAPQVGVEGVDRGQSQAGVAGGVPKSISQRRNCRPPGLTLWPPSPQPPAESYTEKSAATMPGRQPPPRARGPFLHHGSTWWPLSPSDPGDSADLIQANGRRTSV